MGIYVHDGILLGVVTNSPPNLDNSDIEEILDKIQTIIDTHQFSSDIRNAKPIACLNIDGGSAYYLGFFWHWSERGAMELDFLWKPLHKHNTKSGQNFKKADYQQARDLLFQILKPHLPDLSKNKIKFHEVRFFS